MNHAALKKSLKSHEGIKPLLYLDSEGVPTIGVGHNLQRPISQAAIEQILTDDIAECVTELDRAFPKWRDHDDNRQNVLVEMMFNLGATRLAKFKRFWTAMDAKDYSTAAVEMQLSAWRKQVGQRAVTLSNRMRDGIQ